MIKEQVRPVDTEKEVLCALEDQQLSTRTAQSPAPPSLNFSLAPGNRFSSTDVLLFQWSTWGIHLDMELSNENTDKLILRQYLPFSLKLDYISTSHILPSSPISQNVSIPKLNPSAFCLFLTSLRRLSSLSPESSVLPVFSLSLWFPFSQSSQTCIVLLLSERTRNAYVIQPFPLALITDPLEVVLHVKRRHGVSVPSYSSAG